MFSPNPDFTEATNAAFADLQNQITDLSITVAGLQTDVTAPTNIAVDAATVIDAPIVADASTAE